MPGSLGSPGGEMCIGPVGFAAVTRWAPSHLTALLISAWFLSDAVAFYVGSLFGAYYSEFAPAALATQFIIWGIIGAGVLVAINRWLKRLTGELDHAGRPSSEREQQQPIVAH